MTSIQRQLSVHHGLHQSPVNGEAHPGFPTSMRIFIRRCCALLLCASSWSALKCSACRSATSLRRTRQRASERYPNSWAEQFCLNGRATFSASFVELFENVGVRRTPTSFCAILLGIPPDNSSSLRPRCFSRRLLDGQTRNGSIADLSRALANMSKVTAVWIGLRQSA